MINEESDVNINMYFSPDIGLMEQDPPQNMSANVAQPTIVPQPVAASAATDYSGPIVETRVGQASLLPWQAAGGLHPSPMQASSLAMSLGPHIQGISVQSYQPRTDIVMTYQGSPGTLQKRGSPSCDNADRIMDPNQPSAKKQSRGNNRTPASNKNK